MQIRDATLDDLAAIVAIYNASVPGRMATADLAPVTVESRRPWFDEHSPGSRPLWVLEESGTIAGWLSLQAFHTRPAYHATVEVSVYVAPDAQRKGYARKLVARMIDRAGEFGIATVLALIFGHNEPSLALFRNFGFETWGHLPRVAKLDGIERDVVILGRRIE
jgi:L-amino acid N-acyltransferase YncA